MHTTDTSEKGLEALIVRHLTNQPPLHDVPGHTAQLVPGHYAAGGYAQGQSADYNRDLALDVPKLLDFLRATQPKIVESLELAQDGIKRTQFLHRLPGRDRETGQEHRTWYLAAVRRNLKMYRYRYINRRFSRSGSRHSEVKVVE